MTNLYNNEGKTGIALYFSKVTEKKVRERLLGRQTAPVYLHN